MGPSGNAGSRPVTLASHSAGAGWKHSVVQWHPFSLFFGGSPTKNGLPQKGFPFFPRVTEQLRAFYQ